MAADITAKSEWQEKVGYERRMSSLIYIPSRNICRIVFDALPRIAHLSCCRRLDDVAAWTRRATMQHHATKRIGITCTTKQRAQAARCFVLDVLPTPRYMACFLLWRTS